MKTRVTTIPLLTALLLAPLAAHAQDDEPRNLKKPEVDIARERSEARLGVRAC